VRAFAAAHRAVCDDPSQLALAMTACR
jgi:hypothetical protein